MWKPISPKIGLDLVKNKCVSAGSKLNKTDSSNLISLYIHIPFCRKKCSYCAFYSVLCTPEKEAAYLLALKTEMQFYAEHFPDQKIKTIYLGGGSPSILSTDILSNVFQLISNNFHVSTNC